jgi:hypothetical protein
MRAWPAADHLSHARDEHMLQHPAGLTSPPSTIRNTSTSVDITATSPTTPPSDNDDNSNGVIHHNDHIHNPGAHRRRRRTATQHQRGRQDHRPDLAQVGGVVPEWPIEPADSLLR